MGCDEGRRNNTYPIVVWKKKWGEKRVCIRFVKVIFGESLKKKPSLDGGKFERHSPKRIPFGEKRPRKRQKLEREGEYAWEGGEGAGLEGIGKSKRFRTGNPFQGSTVSG